MKRGICCCSMALQDARPPAFGVPFGVSSGEAIHGYGPHHTNLPNWLSDWPSQTPAP